MEPTDAFSRAALVGVRWRKGNPYQDRRALRVSQRLAAGMSVAEVARAERADTAAIESLLAQDGFTAVIESWRAMAEQPEAEQTARLVRLARLAIENALTDWDMGAAFFVLRENAQGRDPAHTIAERIIATAKRTAAPVAPRRRPRRAHRRPPRRRHRAPTTRSTPWSTARPPPCAAPCIAEQAVRAEAAATVAADGAAATMAAARKALALKADAARRPSLAGRPSDPSTVRRHRDADRACRRRPPTRHAARRSAAPPASAVGAGGSACDPRPSP